MNLLINQIFAYEAKHYDVLFNIKGKYNVLRQKEEKKWNESQRIGNQEYIKLFQGIIGIKNSRNRYYKPGYELKKNPLEGGFFLYMFLFDTRFFTL